MFNQTIADARAGKINLILCKDLSRLGRDYIEAGRYTDTIHKNNEMLVILKNVMNDLYARNTSSKIRAVKQSTFKSGKYVGCYAPIGYRKSLADKHILEIDPVTAPIVRRIFDMRLQSDTFRKIARTLNEEGVPSPRGFYYMAEGRPNLRGVHALKDYRSRKRHADKHYGSYKAYMCNRYGCGGKAACFSHYINCNTLTKLMLLDIRAKAMLSQNSPATLKEKILAQKNDASLEQTKALRATLAALDKRLAELEKLVVSAYEDKVKGVMPEALCVQLMNRYEVERRDKLEQRTQFTAQLEATQEDERAADEWLNLIWDYSQLEELDRHALLRLVKRIEVGNKYQVDGEPHRDIKIYYYFVGHIEL